MEQACHEGEVKDDIGLPQPTKNAYCHFKPELFKVIRMLEISIELESVSGVGLEPKMMMDGAEWRLFLVLTNDHE